MFEPHFLPFVSPRYTRCRSSFFYFAVRSFIFFIFIYEEQKEEIFSFSLPPPSFTAPQLPSTTTTTTPPPPHTLFNRLPSPLPTHKAPKFFSFVVSTTCICIYIFIIRSPTKKTKKNKYLHTHSTFHEPHTHGYTPYSSWTESIVSSNSSFHTNTHTHTMEHQTWLEPPPQFLVLSYFCCVGSNLFLCTNAKAK